MMKRTKWIWTVGLGILTMAIAAAIAWAAYSSHQNDQDIANFMQIYPFARSTKLDDCSLCHPGGSITQGGKASYYGSCDYCHTTYGLQAPHGEVPLNTYGQAYQGAGRSQQALRNIEGLDSDGDGYTNLSEIQALSFPGDKADHPGLVAATAVSLDYDQIKKLREVKEFLFFNASKSQDWYAEYRGAKVQDILRKVRLAPGATRITVFAPDGFSKSFPLDAPDPQTPPNISYDVYGPYPKGAYYGALDFVDYPEHPVYPYGFTIPDDLSMILAYKREGKPLTVGKLVPDPANPGRLVLEGEGPYRLAPPQKIAGSPDRPSTAAPIGDGFDYDSTKDHNAGFSIRSVTAIRVEPLPAGTTDFGWTEKGWNLVDQARLVVYGAIEPFRYPIAGEISDCKGKPVAGVQISFSLKSMAQVGSAATGADGRFRMDLPMGQYVVSPIKQGYAFKPDTAEIDVSKKGTRIKFKAHPTP
jgi:hypothetical protein